MDGNLCDIKNKKISWYLILAGWHHKERDIVLDFFQLQLFRLLITKSHTLNCYSFLLKFLLKTKSLLATLIAQFTAKTTNSQKAIYFLSLMSCSINQPKSQKLITCKDFIFSDFTWKKRFCCRKWREEGDIFSLRPCENMQQIYRRTPMCNFALGHCCYPVNLLHIFRTSFLKDTSGQLLLEITFFCILF